MRLWSRLVWVVVGLVVLTAVGVGTLVYDAVRQAVIPQGLQRLHSDVEGLAILLEADTSEARKDITALLHLGLPSRFKPDGSADSGDEQAQDEWRERLTNLLLAQMRAKPDYLQFRFIEASADGMEIIRVEREASGAPPRVVPAADLQPKADRDYYRETIKLGAAQFYVSPLDLNQEFGQIQVPHVPVLRVAAPVRVGDNPPVGMLIINMDMRPLLKHIRASAPPAGAIYLLNSDGETLLHPDPKFDFSYQLGRSHKLHVEYPQLAELQTSPRGGNKVAGLAQQGETAISWTTAMLAEQRPVILVETMPVHELTAAQAVGRSALLGGGMATLLAALAAGFLIRTVAKPVNRMARAIEAMNAGKPYDLPTDAGGEIGLLARAFAERAEKESLYFTLIGNSNDAILTKQMDGTITSWNPGAERLYGYSAADAIGQNINLIVPEDRRAELRDILDSIERGEEVSSFETLRRARDGRMIDVSLSVSPIRSPNGQLIGAAAIARDITQRKRADDILRLAVEACPTGMLLVDYTGKIVLANEEIIRQFGYRKDELLGQSVDILVPDGTRPHHPELRAYFLAHPERRPMGAGRDLRGKRKDGSTFPVEIGLTPIPTATGVMVLGAIVDISERMAARQALELRSLELQRSNADLEQFAYVASHDLQEPLRMVASFTQLLAERYKGQIDDKADRYIHFIVDGAARMQRLINDLLLYSRVSAHNKPPTPVDVSATIERLCLEMQSTIAESGARLEYDNLPTVLADQTQLSRLFQNLLSNALKFRGEASPVIRIAAARENGLWHFTVADNGIGFDAKDGKKIFEMFQRLHERGKYDGTGLGLAICKRIVEQWGGTIFAESEPGKGSVFHFTVPIVTEDAA